MNLLLARNYGIVCHIMLFLHALLLFLNNGLNYFLRDKKCLHNCKSNINGNGNREVLFEVFKSYVVVCFAMRTWGLPCPLSNIVVVVVVVDVYCTVDELLDIYFFIYIFRYLVVD